jgi:hypothetical protein
VEGVASPRVEEKVTHEAPTASGIQDVEKSTFFLVKRGFSLPNWFFQQSFVVFDYISRPNICPSSCYRFDKNQFFFVCF